METTSKTVAAIAEMEIDPAEGTFSAPPQVHTFDGLLFDFDGTIVDSTEGKHSSEHSVGRMIRQQRKSPKAKGVQAKKIRKKKGADRFCNK